MGVIEHGAVHGFLPETEGFAVHYPAYPSSTARAIETLGGLDEIVKRRSSEDRYLELRFRPEDPYCHPTFGDLRSSCGLLLRISKKKGMFSAGHGAQSGAEEPSCSTQLHADVVARVTQGYHFEGMADYQYVVPVHAAKSRKRKKERSHLESRFEKGGLTDLEEDDVMMLVPPLFSPKDIPEHIVLKSAPGLVSKQLQKGIVEQRWEMDMEPCLAVPFNTEKIPAKVDWEPYISKDSLEWQYQSAVSELFNERPIWPRTSLHERLVDDGLQATDHHMRRLLARSGYYFATGPFGKFWIRKGYDPRKYPESKIYQRVDFRIPEQLRRISSYGAKDRSKPKWKELCGFQSLPMKAFTSLQFYELEDDYIHHEITKPTQKKNCTHSTGWLSKHVHEILSLQVRVRFLSIFDHGIARNMLKSTRKQLEKTKRLLFMGDLGISEDDSDFHNDHDKFGSSNQRSGIREDEPDLNCEVDNDAEVGNEVVELSNLHPVRDGKGGCSVPVVEEEEEDVEDEADEYRFSSMGGDDEGFSTNFSSNPRSYDLGENISGDFLQDILSGFQSKGGKGNVQQTDTDDGEYQIYEQESGDEFSD